MTRGAGRGATVRVEMVVAVPRPVVVVPLSVVVVFALPRPGMMVVGRCPIVDEGRLGDEGRFGGGAAGCDGAAEGLLAGGESFLSLFSPFPSPFSLSALRVGVTKPSAAISASIASRRLLMRASVLSVEVERRAKLDYFSAANNARLRRCWTRKEDKTRLVT